MACEIFFVSRLLLQLILLALFLHFFGLPAIWRFQAKEVRKSNEMILTTPILVSISLVTFFGFNKQVSLLKFLVKQQLWIMEICPMREYFETDLLQKADK